MVLREVDQIGNVSDYRVRLSLLPIFPVAHTGYLSIRNNSTPNTAIRN